ncbi:IS30 family transposase [Arthrobacter oryzae]|uniref:IS30 family transposase n=1 Tax=Arthrobacter oryzae TaxID=409290 RepID=A0A3N0C120_9MICC|nr:IS30 family transposase [Arthrobacter oryzae]
MICDRPEESGDRFIPGAWQWDLIVGTQNRSAIATLVERLIRYLLLVHRPGINRAEDVYDGLIAALHSLPPALRTSPTWDQGSEMGKHAEFTAITGVPVCFCAAGWFMSCSAGFRSASLKGTTAATLPLEVLKCAGSS